MRIHTRLIISAALLFNASVLCAQNDSTATDATAQQEERFGPPTRSLGKVQSADRIDISQGGSVCYSSPAALELWRPHANQAAWLTIEDIAGGKRARVAWPLDQQTLAWPLAQVPVTPDMEYLVQYEDMPVAVTLYPVPADLADAKAQQAWMQEKGCFW